MRGNTTSGGIAAHVTEGEVGNGGYGKVGKRHLCQVRYVPTGGGSWMRMWT